MPHRIVLAALFLIASAVLPLSLQAAGPQGAQTNSARAEKSSGVPRLYVAAGPTADSDLARLHAAIGKLAGIKKVETRPEFEAVTVTVEGDGRSTESLITAAARSAGYMMRPVRPRFFAAVGPVADADLRRLRSALQAVHGVETVNLSARSEGAAVRVFGMVGSAALVSAAKPAGFALRQQDSYVASGSSSESDLSGLRASLEKVSGVEQIDMQGLSGGATLVIYGDPKDSSLETAAKSAGYAFWPLLAASGPSIYKVEGKTGTPEATKLREALMELEGIGEVDVRAVEGGQRLTITGGKVRGEKILTAASDAGFTLTSVEPPVALPTLVPVAGRSTPPDFDARVLEEKAIQGEAAPDFIVIARDGVTKRTLSDYLTAKKPVVLIFGSCT